MNIFKTLSGYLKKSPEKACPENVKVADFNFLPGDNLVVYAGNPDKKCRTSELVIDAIVKLSNIVDDLKCVIVCGGKNIEEKVKKANECIGKDIVFALNDDYSDIISSGKLFVGEGKAVKAAMLAGKPVIIAGDNGYIGIFDESKKEKCIEADFSCKSETKTNSGLLAQDIGAYFGLWEDEQEKLGELGRQTALEYFSAKRMTDDAEKVYKSLLED